MSAKRPYMVGDRLLLGPDPRRWWTVRAASDRFTVCVQQVPFQKRGTLRYTVLDPENERRGPCNLIGWGYGDGSYSEAECAEMLAEFESGDLEVSHRNNVPLVVVAERRRGSALPGGAA